MRVDAICGIARFVPRLIMMDRSNVCFASIVMIVSVKRAEVMVMVVEWIHPDVRLLLY